MYRQRGTSRWISSVRDVEDISAIIVDFVCFTTNIVNRIDPHMINTLFYGVQCGSLNLFELYRRPLIDIFNNFKTILYNQIQKQWA